MLGERCFASFHRSAGDEDDGDVEAHRSVEHSRCDFVAVGNTNHGISAMRVHHIFNRIGNDISRRQAVEHAVVAHGNAIVHRNGVELFSHPTGLLNFSCNELTQILKVHVTGYKLGKRVDHRDDRLLEVAIGHAGCAPKRSRPRHIASSGRCS